MARRGNGEGSIYKDSQGRWTAALTLPPDPTTGKTKRKYIRARTRADVIRKLRQAQASLATPGVHAASSLMMSQWARTWLERDVAPRRKPATTRDYEGSMRLYVIPTIGRRRLDQLDTTDVRQVHRAVAGAGRSAATVSRVHRALAACLAAAEREGLILRNPARFVSPPPLRQAPAPMLSAEQVHTYLRSRLDQPDYVRRLVAFTLGARQGEVLGITLDHLHLDAPTPSVELAWEVKRVTWAHGCGATDTGRQHACGRVRGADCPERHAPVPEHLEAERVHGGLWLLRPKTVGSWRHVALPATLADALRTHLAQTRPVRFVFEAAPGAPIDPRVDWGEWTAGLRAAGLPHVRLHSARASVATRLLEEGAPQRLIMEILGHTQAATTSHYQRPSLAFQERALTSVETALAGS
ncbi:site-specific tyrosine recombinase XerC [Actinomyces bovis]|uniref:Site-specific tyrosine recombinase XerC n=1 Tax=Actinomyces bovis TaxID=1658 RepID=A0ABY1VM52_9ACTO|nr:tyrosine-type recombinase/integrase [Actinomyces bovis]SPT53090.1 site-specific tyrosine recombinase XerC [Actinomyces bovis]SPT53766.1 site-specific tyrosine recombinase XerC [Actinomyces bovis]VEG53104.1 site-specific tyrosine recombinase XerC [Actinomyces israelii]